MTKFSFVKSAVDNPTEESILLILGYELAAIVECYKARCKRGIEARISRLG